MHGIGYAKIKCLTFRRRKVEGKRNTRRRNLNIHTARQIKRLSQEN